MDEPGFESVWLVVCRCLKGTVGARRAKHKQLVGKASGLESETSSVLDEVAWTPWWPFIL